MYIEPVPNRDSPPAVLLRESYREEDKGRKRTLANLSCLSAEVIEGLKVLLRVRAPSPRRPASRTATGSSEWPGRSAHARRCLRRHGSARTRLEDQWTARMPRRRGLGGRRATPSQGHRRAVPLDCAPRFARAAHLWACSSSAQRRCSQEPPGPRTVRRRPHLIPVRF